MFFGCRRTPRPGEHVDVIDGGTRDESDYDAPKEIESHELVSFETEFFRNSDWVYDKERYYDFKLKKSEDGTFVVTEGYNDDLRSETDADFAAKLDQLIRDQDLIRLNGMSRQTYGILPEYGPYLLRAEYASGEKLYFYINDDPNAAWTFAMLDLFAREFGAHGVNDLLPPKETSEMTRFSLEYAFDDIRYCYGEIIVPVTEEEKNRTFEEIVTHGYDESGCETMVYSRPWDRSGKTETGGMVKVPIVDGYYAGLQKIVEENELAYIQNGEIIPSDFDYENTPQFYEFYIEYASGKRMSGFSCDPEKCEKFRPIAEAFSAYYEDYLAKNARITEDK